MSFEPKTFSEIFEAMRQRTGPQITDFGVGSVARTLYETFAYELALLYEKLHQVYLAGYIDTAEGQQLDMVVAILGIERSLPDFAVGEVIFERDVGSEDIDIPLGTLVATADTQGRARKTYTTIEPKVLSKDQATVAVKVQAIERGEDQSTAPGTVVVMPRPIPRIKSVTNRDTLTVSGRRRRESDDELRARSKNALIASGKATIFSLEHALFSLPGVKDVKVREHFHFARGRVLFQGVPETNLVIPRGTLLLAQESHDTLKKAFRTTETTVIEAVPFGGQASTTTAGVQAALEGQAGEINTAGEAVLWQIADEQLAAQLQVRNEQPLRLDQFGLVEVFVDSADFADPNSPAYDQERERLMQAIDRVRAAGVMVRLEAAVIVRVDGVFRIEANPTLRLSATERADLEGRVRKALIRHVDDKKMGQSLLFAQLIKEALLVDGVDTLDDFSITITNEHDHLVNHYDSNGKRVEIESFERFRPGSICVASETKLLPIHIRFKATQMDAITREQVATRLTRYFNTLPVGRQQTIPFAAIEEELRQALNMQPIEALEMVAEPWCSRATDNGTAIDVSFVEQPALGDLFVYKTIVQIDGAIKLSLPSTTTSAEKNRVREEISARVHGYLNNLRTEADIVFADIIELLRTVEPVLRVDIEPEQDFVLRQDGIIIRDRVSKDGIAIQEFERAQFGFICITDAVERVRVEVLELEIAANLQLRITTPFPADGDEAAAVAALQAEAQARLSRAAKEAINTFLAKAAPGDDVVAATLQIAIRDRLVAVNSVLEGGPGVSGAITGSTINRLVLRATALSDGRVQQVPMPQGEQPPLTDIHIRSVETAFMQQIALDAQSLTSLPASIGQELEAQIISLALRAAFTTAGITLSSNLELSATTAQTWQLRDLETQRSYLIRSDSSSGQPTLNVYARDPVTIQLNIERVELPAAPTASGTADRTNP